ncbi:hypothetical protein [Desulfovibrio inopinatus]|uniref:hypothetical protein n=1 Tax=Desulfovibrio inopinatus TaxID=102109 RepID=UPI0004128D2B|nr:hypothetical protein [Desulfovibrio inopinatus]
MHALFFIVCILASIVGLPGNSLAENEISSIIASILLDDEGVTNLSGTVILPDGVSLASCQIETSLSTTTMGSDGQYTIETFSDEPQLALAVDASGNVVLLGFIGEGQTKLDSLSTAKALVFFGLGFYSLSSVDDALTLLDTQESTLAPLVEAIESAMQTDPAALAHGNSDIHQALLDVVETFRQVSVSTTHREAIPNALSITPTQGASGLRLNQLSGFNTIRLTNGYRRRPIVLIEELGYVPELSDTFVTLSGINYLVDPYWLAPTDGLNGSVGTFGDLLSGKFAYEEVADASHYLPLHEGSKKTVYRVSVLGLGAFAGDNDGSLSSNQIDKMHEAWGTALLFDIFIPLVLNIALPATGSVQQYYEMQPSLMKDAGFWSDLTNFQILMWNKDGLLNSLSGGHIGDAVHKLLEYCVFNGTAQKQAANLIRYVASKLGTSSGTMGNLNTVFKNASNLFFALGVLDIAMSIGDQLTVIGHAAMSNQADVWEIDATKAKIVMAPESSEIEPDFVETFKVTLPDTTGSIGDEPTFSFVFNNTGNAGVLTNAIATGNTITTSSDWINYKGREEGSDTVTVDVTWKRPLDSGGFEDVYLGKTTSAIEVVDDGVTIEPADTWVCNQALELTAVVTAPDLSGTTLSYHWTNSGNSSTITDGVTTANSIESSMDHVTYTPQEQGQLDDTVMVTVYKDDGSGKKELVGYGKAFLHRPVATITPDVSRIMVSKSVDLAAKVEDGVSDALYSYAWSGGTAGSLVSTDDTAVYTAGTDETVDVVALNVTRTDSGNVCKLAMAQAEIDVISATSPLAGVRDLVVESGETLILSPGVYEFDTFTISGTLLLRGDTTIRVVEYRTDENGNPNRADAFVLNSNGRIQSDVVDKKHGADGRPAASCVTSPPDDTYAPGRSGESGQSGSAGGDAPDLTLEVFGNARITGNIDLSGGAGGRGGDGGYGASGCSSENYTGRTGGNGGAGGNGGKGGNGGYLRLLIHGTLTSGGHFYANAGSGGSGGDGGAAGNGEICDKCSPGNGGVAGVGGSGGAPGEAGRIEVYADNITTKAYFIANGASPGSPGQGGDGGNGSSASGVGCKDAGCSWTDCLCIPTTSGTVGALAHSSYGVGSAGGNVSLRSAGTVNVSITANGGGGGAAGKAGEHGAPSGGNSAACFTSHDSRPGQIGLSGSTGGAGGKVSIEATVLDALTVDTSGGTGGNGADGTSASDPTTYQSYDCQCVPYEYGDGNRFDCDPTAYRSYASAGVGGNGGLGGQGGTVHIRTANYDDTSLHVSVAGGDGGQGGDGGTTYDVSGFSKTKVYADEGEDGASGSSGTSSITMYTVDWTTDLTVSDSAVQKGDLLTYRFSLTTDAALSDAHFTLPLPEHVYARSVSTGGYNYDGRTWNWIADVGAGETYTVECTADTSKITEATTLSVTGTVKTPLGEGSSPTVQTTVTP